MVKTEPVEKVKAEEIPKSSNGWKVASYISFVVIVGLIILNVVPRANNMMILEKSIAVLPFDNDGPASENSSYINGYCTAVHSNLCKIKDLRVLALQSTEHYRNQPKSIPEITRELGVGYVLSARGQIINNRVRLTVYLTNASNDILWSNPYDRQIEIVDDHINIQSEIAELVARELQAAITPEEKQIIEKIPTTSLTALNFYQRGREEFFSGNIDRAEELYIEALSYDSEYALAYCGLATVYWNRNFWRDYYSESFMDSAMSLVDKALKYDPQISEAYVLRGRYNAIIGNIKVAIDAYSYALNLNPNDWMAYREMGSLYSDNDVIKSIINYQKAISLNKEPEVLPNLLRSISYAYWHGGIPEKRDAYRLEAFKLDKDTVEFYNALMIAESYSLNYEKAVEYGKKALALDSSNSVTLEFLGDTYSNLGDEESALYCKTRYLERLKEQGALRINDMHRVAYIFWMNGLAEEAEEYFSLQMDYCMQDIALNRPRATGKYSYYDLAGIYAFRGEEEKALDNLRVFNQRRVMPSFMVYFIKWDPLFEILRDNPEFQQILSDVEAKYQAEHERVRQWLEEKDML